MKKKLTWEETKRQASLQKHGLHFADAGEVLKSRYRLDLMVERDGERRLQSFSCVMNRLAGTSGSHFFICYLIVRPQQKFRFFQKRLLRQKWRFFKVVFS